MEENGVIIIIISVIIKDIYIALFRRSHKCAIRIEHDSHEAGRRAGPSATAEPCRSCVAIDARLLADSVREYVFCVFSGFQKRDFLRFFLK